MVYSARTRIVIYLFVVFLYAYTLLVKWNYLEGHLFFRNYLADVLFIPIVVPVSWYVSQRIIPNSNASFLIAIIITILMVSILFEWALPLKSKRYTADLWDILAYSIGGLLTYFEYMIAKRKLLFVQ